MVKEQIRREEAEDENRRDDWFAWVGYTACKVLAGAQMPVQILQLCLRATWVAETHDKNTSSHLSY